MVGGVEGVESEFFLRLEGGEENLERVLGGVVVGVCGKKGDVVEGFFFSRFYYFFYF